MGADPAAERVAQWSSRASQDAGRGSNSQLVIHGQFRNVALLRSVTLVAAFWLIEKAVHGDRCVRGGTARCGAVLCCG